MTLRLIALTTLLMFPETTRADQSGRIGGLGRILPEQGVTDLVSPIGDVVDSVFVKKGDTVKAGALLVTLQSRHQARLELNRASAEVEEIQEMADRTLKLIRVEIAALEYAVVQARARQQRLMDAGEKYRLERQLEDSAREVFLARNQLDRAREGLQKDRYTWEINIRQARHGLVMAQERYNRTVLRAPSEGTVLHIHRKTGEAAAGPLVSIADLSRMIVIADVAETDIGKISPGMRATATARAFPDELTGEVFSVDRWIDGNTQIGKVYIRLTRAVPANRFINMQVSVTIHTAR